MNEHTAKQTKKWKYEPPKEKHVQIAFSIKQRAYLQVILQKCEALPAMAMNKFEFAPLYLIVLQRILKVRRCVAQYDALVYCIPSVLRDTAAPLQDWPVSCSWGRSTSFVLTSKWMTRPGRGSNDPG